MTLLLQTPPPFRHVTILECEKIVIWSWPLPTFLDNVTNFTGFFEGVPKEWFFLVVCCKLHSPQPLSSCCSKLIQDQESKSKLYRFLCPVVTWLLAPALVSARSSAATLGTMEWSPHWPLPLVTGQQRPLSLPRAGERETRIVKLHVRRKIVVSKLQPET